MYSEYSSSEAIVDEVALNRSELSGPTNGEIAVAD